tara:strand:+ start:3582 stop:3995 length:414 start_codon:yes stop_codon:yes gene_type:complete
MPKHIASEYLYSLPSGKQVHPFRLIVRDGSIMWKHALLYNNTELNIPYSEAVEVHIVKTAHRLEELNAWLSPGLEPWESFVPHCWYYPEAEELRDGISLYMRHQIFTPQQCVDSLTNHLLEHETLELRDKYLFFKRC